MKTMLIIAVLFCIGFSLQAQTAYVKRVKCDSASLGDVEEYHESDTFIGRFDNYTVYLNQTSPVKDTIYVIQVIVPSPQCTGTTKSGNRCKVGTRHKSGRCHHHRPKEMTMYQSSY